MNNGFRGFPLGQLSNQSNSFRAWRVRNLDAPTGSSAAQWLCYELELRISGVNQAFNAAGQSISSGYPGQARLAFDSNGGTFADTNGSTFEIFCWLGMVFGQELAIDSIRMSNLNNGVNVPPTLYAIDGSNDLRQWQTVWETQPGEIGTLDAVYYLSAKP